jgi:hypothetical protein
LALDGVDEDAEPTTVLTNDADRNGAFVRAKTIVDDRNDCRLSSLRSAADDIHEPRLKRENARGGFNTGPKDELAKLEIHQNSTAIVEATCERLNLENQ